MKNEERSLEQTSEKLLNYLQAKLVDYNINYKIPLNPLLGGVDASIYFFQLETAQAEFSKPLVLRLFSEYHPTFMAIKESSIQNELVALKFPVPHVYIAECDKFYLGGAFLIMDFKPDEMLGIENIEWPVILGKTTAELHNVASGSVQKDLFSKGLKEKHYLFNKQLHLIAFINKFPFLVEIIQWLIDNQPPEPKHLSICHNDITVFNILVKNGSVTAVLDWSTCLIGDPLMDVASTILAIDNTWKHYPILSETGVLPKNFQPSPSMEECMHMYLEAYRSVRLLDLKDLDYYRVWKCVLRLLGAANGMEFWFNQPSVLKDFIKQVYEVTKINITFPNLVKI